MDGHKDQVSFFSKVFKKYGEKSRHHGEFGLGANPHAKVELGYPLRWEAEKKAGILHCGFGNSIDTFDEFGKFKPPSVRPGIHIDNLLIAPTIRVDSSTLVRNGKMQL